jgi:hypothetical protein
MVSAWWLIVAFMVGGGVGILLVALMRMSGQQPEPSTSTANVPDLNGMPW